MLKLTFVNYDAVDGMTEIECDRVSVIPIMTWYGGYHAGDNYEVIIDGEKILTDHNGLPLNWEE
jgi:hypothetical protein